ncbi:MAG: polysaccharide biosynthesis tyrosine autokinase [Muribaculaceae bacterium]|nr:polysaccharide biosynthesis tyrosine autokinase [Muribaculaceae bacterium]
MNTSYSNSVEKEKIDDFSIMEFFHLCLSKWKWFLLSFVFFVGIGAVYILRKQPVYEREEQVLVKNDHNGGMGSLPSSFSSLGLISGNTDVNNELITITSPHIMSTVVERLKLDYNYTLKKFPHGITLYGHSLPINVELPDLPLQEGAAMRLDLSKKGNISLYKLVKYSNGDKEKYDEEVSGKINSTLKTPLGRVSVTSNPLFDGSDLFKDSETITIIISKSPKQSAIEEYSEKLVGDLADEDADVIDLSIKDVNIERADDILNMVLTVYNENWVDDKNKLTVATSQFINDRLQVIQQELGDVDQTIAKYQSQTKTLGTDESTKISLRKESDHEHRIISVANELAMAEYLRDFISDPKNRYSLMPPNLGIYGKEDNNQIKAYNDMLLERNRLVTNSSENNPLLEEYNANLLALHSIILKGLTTHIQSLKSTLESSRKAIAQEENKMESTPGKILPLLSESRQRKVKESLYLFLLERREENELSQKFTADNLRVITPPMGSLRPVAPKKMLIILVCLIIAFGLPAAILYFSEVFNTKVRGKKDLENVKMPFAGEIPHVGKKRKLKIDAKGKLIGRKEETAPISVVAEGKRDVVNEAFRVIRSNIDFMSGKDKGCQVVLLTSFNPGSGKSFISYNLGLSFAIKHKKVLLVDCDLRHGSSSMYVGMPKKGLSDYLTGNTNDWEELIKTAPGNPNLSIMPIGKMPPNPAELLENGRLDQLVEQAKKDYDYILLDCPPVNIVVDTNIVGRLADRTLFVVRAGLLERSALKELNELYEEKKFKNMSVILNGTEAIHSRYYTYGNYQYHSK